MDEALPTSAHEAEGLILALYEPSSPHTISQIQETLHLLQRSPAGWWIARDLLARSDDKVRFFGALTIIVKLNTESDSLPADDAQDLLQCLNEWLSASLARDTGPMVTRKLTSALVAFFLHFPRYWQDCIKSLCLFLASPGKVRCDLTNDTMSQNLLDRLGHRELQAALWFTAALVEEAGKTDMNSSRHIGLYEATVHNVPSAVLLMSHCFINVEQQSLLEDCIKCLQSWIWFSQRVALRGDDTISSLRTLTEPVLSALCNNELFETAGELVTDILSSYPGFLLDVHYDALFDILDSPWAHNRYHRLVGGDFDFDSVLFGQLMLSLGDSRVQDLVESVDLRAQAFLLRLRGLACAQGYPVAEDKVFVHALEFWSTFVETMIDSMHTRNSEIQPWIDPAMSHVLETVSNVWRKIAFPPPDEYVTWDSTDRVAFGDARKDVADLLQSTFAVTGPSLVSTFADLVLQKLSPGEWFEMEAAAFCLGSLADCVVGDACDNSLRQVFSSELFTILQESRNEIPPRTRQTCITLVERYAEFFERDTAGLPAALRLLFSVLPDATLAGPAAKSIQRLCYSSRQILATEANSFLDQYRLLSLQHQLDCPTSEKVGGAISSVIQAIADDAERLYYLDELLQFVQNDVALSQRAILASDIMQNHRCPLSSETPDMAEHMALKALRALISIGKGFRTPIEGPVDLESESRVAYAGQQERLLRVQLNIMATIQQLQNSHPKSSEVVECICTILRTGFSETEAGPFVFPPDIVASYLTAQTHPGPRLGLFVSAACSFTSSINQETGPDFDIIRSKVLAWVMDLLHQLPEPEHDTELSQNGIEFVSRLLSRKPEVLLREDTAESAEAFFRFTLRVLDGREPLPKAAAADFWATLVSVRSSDATVQNALGSALEHLGPLLAQSLVQNVGGNAARSELDKLTEPLKKLVNQQVKARSWLEQALFDENFPSDQVSAEERTRFLKKIISLRGSRATNQVVREFWLAARGSKFAYAS